MNFLNYLKSKCAEPSSEENGIYVQVPVKNDDIGQFNKIFQNFSAYLSNRLLLVNEEFNHKLPTLSNETFDFYERNWSSSSQFDGSSYVLMGGILYPVNSNQLDRDTHFKAGVVYKAEIGEFKLHHSREALEYNEKTLSALKTASEKIAQSFASIAEAKVSSCANLYDACKLYEKTLKPTSSNLGIKSSITWKGHNISSLLIESHSDIEKVQLFRRLRNGNLSLQTIKHGWRIDASCSADSYIVIDDGVDVKALKNRLSWIEKENVYVISPKNLQPLIERSEAMADKHFSLLSSHERKIAPRKASSTSGVSKGDIMELAYAVYRNANCWKRVDEELSDNETHYYVEWHNNKVRTAEFDRSPQDYFQQVCQLKKINPKLTKVYGVRKKALAKIEKKSNWVALESVSTDWINNSEVVKSTKLLKQLMSVVSPVTRIPMLKDAIKKSDSNEIILNLKKSIKVREDIYDKADLSLEDCIVNRADSHDVSEHENNVKAFQNAYPLLPYLSRPYGQEESNQMLSALVEYLQR